MSFADHRNILVAYPELLPQKGKGEIGVFIVFLQIGENLPVQLLHVLFGHEKSGRFIADRLIYRMVVIKNFLQGGRLLYFINLYLSGVEDVDIFKYVQGEQMQLVHQKAYRLWGGVVVLGVFLIDFIQKCVELLDVALLKGLQQTPLCVLGKIILLFPPVLCRLVKVNGVPSAGEHTVQRLDSVPARLAQPFDIVLHLSHPDGDKAVFVVYLPAYGPVKVVEHLLQLYHLVAVDNQEHTGGVLDIAVYLHLLGGLLLADIPDDVQGIPLLEGGRLPCPAVRHIGQGKGKVGPLQVNIFFVNQYPQIVPLHIAA